jgi:hypothetical protein
MKKHLANSPTLTMLARLQEVHAFFRCRTRAQMLATADPFNTPWLPPDYRRKFVEGCCRRDAEQRGIPAAAYHARELPYGIHTASGRALTESSHRAS